jgi:hypothetical protein
MFCPDQFPDPIRTIEFREFLLPADRRVEVAKERRLLGTASVTRCYGIKPRDGRTMKRLIDLLEDQDRIFFQQWADANVAVFSSALLVEILRGIVGLLIG